MPTTPPEPSPGGDTPGLKDARLAARALGRRWALTPEMRDEALDILMDVARSQGSPRVRVMAARALIQAEAQNAADEHKAQPDVIEHRHSYEEALERVYGSGTTSLPAPADDEETAEAGD